MCHDTQLLFLFLVEREFRHVGQAGLELLTLTDPPTSASQSAEITGLSHCPALEMYIFLGMVLLVCLTEDPLMVPAESCSGLSVCDGQMRPAESKAGCFHNSVPAQEALTHSLDQPY